MRITAIYDNKGKTFDRYTIITDENNSYPDILDMFDCLGMSDNPTDPQGFSQWDAVLRDETRYNSDNKQWRGRCDLGKRIRFEDLPHNLQRHIAYRVLFVDGEEM